MCHDVCDVVRSVCLLRLKTDDNETKIGLANAPRQKY